MTIKEYISQRFFDFGVTLSDATLLSIMLKGALQEGEEVVTSNVKSVEIAITKNIPELLLTPQSVSDGSLSISKASKDALMDYYKMKCKEYGLADQFATQKKRVVFL